ncbi:hypothetical protein [Streptomyces fumanus]|uniref:Uncharacterized protein n=1 Tax=Streptomyces fumanus TaxID=67302 RepID=A0A919E5H8_9ACTN|nr:hypothetical protein [Streptomyces fumanus]GHF14182.1 hypothetical protein GCM10018772_44330 [Streptomyces fumanus]
MKTTEEFLTVLDEGMLRFFREIADELVTRFGISRAEAVARINAAYEGADIDPYPDIMCHEEPEYWAYGLYFLPKDGRLPHGDSVEDLSEWEIRPAPPQDSHVWTLAD